MITDTRTGKTRNLIFLIVAILNVIIVSTAYNSGIKQNRIFRYNHDVYQQAMDSMGEGNYNLALQFCDQLDAKSQATYQVQYLKGICLAETGDYQAAANYMQGAREAWPGLIKDQKFLLRYGIVLYHLGNDERARLYLKESQKYPDDADLAKEADDYLRLIAQKSRGANQRG